MNNFFNTDSLVTYGHEALELIADEYNNLGDKPVVPNVQPGFLRNLLPSDPPERAESFKQILEDTKKLILSNLTQWQHPNFYAYFPSNMCHGSVIGDMISVSFNTPGFTWIASPASTELENIVVDWLVKILGLPETFLLKNEGGGTISNTVGDSIFLSVHAAKHKKRKELGIELDDPRILKFVGYFTGIGHTQNHKGLFIKDIAHRREIPIYFNDEVQNFQIKVEEFEKMVETDINNGLIPFWCGTTLGSTSLGCCDPVLEISKVCKKHGIFINVDAAWAGVALSVPEIREEMGKGLENVDSLVINFGKWGMCGNNSSVFYLANKANYKESLLGGGQLAEYLKNKYTQEFDITDYKDWQIGLGRRFNSLRFWFMIRSIGVEGLRENVTEKIKLAQEFEVFVKQNPRFKMICKRELALVCFHVVQNPEGKDLSQEEINKVNKKILEIVNGTNKFHLTGSQVNDIYYLRFVICNHNTTSLNVQKLWQLLEESSVKAFSEQ